MAMTDREVTQWIAEYDAGLAADVERAERRFPRPPVEPQRSLSLTGATLVSVPGRGDAPEPMPGERDRNWWRDLAERTTVGGCERTVLMVLANRIWTGPDSPRDGRENGRWTGFLTEIQAKCGGALSYRSAQRGVSRLVSKGILTRRLQGRRRARGGGRGKSIYRILPSNRYERR